MANGDRCGAKTKKGGACRYGLEKCPYAAHAGGRPLHGVRAVRRPSAAGTSPAATAVTTEVPVPPAIEGRDLRALG